MVGIRWIVSAALALAIVAGAPAPASAEGDTTSVVEVQADPGREAFDLAVSQFRSGLVAARETCRLEREEVGAIVTRRGEARTSECQRELRELRETFLQKSREARELSHAFRLEQKRLAEERRRAEAERKLAEETARVEREKGEERAKVALRRKLEAEQTRAEKARADKAKAEQVNSAKTLSKKRASLEQELSALEEKIAFKRSESEKHAARAAELLAQADSLTGDQRAKYLLKAADAERLAAEYAGYAREYEARKQEVLAALEKLNSSGS
ncbi:MAG: hypothetical protein ACRDGE_08380 [Candidatus Limnocylindria bacterium]